MSIKKIESKLTALVDLRSRKHYGPDYPDPLPGIVLELCQEIKQLRMKKSNQDLEAIKRRVEALEVAAGFEMPPKEKVRPVGHDYAQDRE